MCLGRQKRFFKLLFQTAVSAAHFQIRNSIHFLCFTTQVPLTINLSQMNSPWGSPRGFLFQISIPQCAVRFPFMQFTGTLSGQKLVAGLNASFGRVFRPILRNHLLISLMALCRCTAVPSDCWKWKEGHPWLLCKSIYVYMVNDQNHWSLHCKTLIRF